VNLPPLPPSFPDTAQTPVFTSKDDDAFGEVLGGYSDEVPQPDAAGALKIPYLVGSAVTIKNARIRWAKTGIIFNWASGYYPVHTVRDTLLEWCDTGISANQYTYLTLVNVQAHDVTQPLYCQGSCSGSVGSPPFVMDKGFRGLAITDTGVAPPDTMGAVGPNHFVEILNGEVDNISLGVFDKTSGTNLETAVATNFFAVEEAGTHYPSTNVMYDPRVLYDHQAQRWVACAFDARGSKQVLLAVSKTSSPLGLVTNWTKYVVHVPVLPGSGPDHPIKQTIGSHQRLGSDHLHYILEVCPPCSGAPGGRALPITEVRVPRRCRHRGDDP
jgi:hypothetical protein